jgi:hypothetical protein
MPTTFHDVRMRVRPRLFAVTEYAGPSRAKFKTPWKSNDLPINFHIYRVYKKKVIELQRAIVSELLCVWTRFFHIRKDYAFSCWLISSSCQMDKKWTNMNPIKNVSQNRIFSPLRVGSKTIESEPPLVLKLMNFTSINDAHIHNYY